MGLEGRLRKLEGAALREFGDWPLEDQLESVAQKIYDVKFFHQYHNPEHKYWCTDREIRLAMYIAEIIEAEREDKAPPPFDPARYRVAKIPEIFAPYLRRWDSGRLGPQSERDRWLYNDRHRAKADRERIAWEWSPEGRRQKALERVEAARRDLDYRNGVRVRYFAEPPIPEREDERLSKALAELAEIEAELEEEVESNAGELVEQGR